MNKNYISKLLVGLFVLLVGCTDSSETTHSHEKSYTCPMHPHIVQTEPGACPICGMVLVERSGHDETAVDSSLLPLLKATNAQVVSQTPTIQAERGARILTLPAQGRVAFDNRQQIGVSSRVGGRVEKVAIKYNYQPVRKGQLLFEIYSPELVSAQRELIYLSQNNGDAALIQGARQKLLLLGMQPSQIDQVMKAGKPEYRVSVYSPVGGFIVDRSALSVSDAEPFMSSPKSAESNGMSGMGSAASATSSPVVTDRGQKSSVVVREGQYVAAGESVFTIYKQESLLAEFYLDPVLGREVKRGKKILYRSVARPREVLIANVGLVEPVQRGGEKFGIARVYLQGSNLHPGELLRADVAVVIEQGWWLPQSAVVNVGQKSVVFKKEGAVFIPREVQAGISADGVVQIVEDISTWQVAATASFMVDSESFIRTTKNE